MAHLKEENLDGGLAQLVERLLCKQDVSSSSLLTSIGFLESLLQVVVFQ